VSVQAITKALEVRGVSASEKLLLLVLANYADENFRCWPSQSRLADETGLTDRTIRAVLASLEGRGLLSRQPRSRRDGSQGTDIITLALDGHRKSLPPETVSTGNRRTDHRKSTTGSPEAVSALTTFEPSLTVIEPSNAREPAGRKPYPEGFEAVWKAYPHTPGRSSKPESAKLWSKLPPEEKSSLLGAIAQFSAKVETICGGKGAPDMAVWLRQGKHLSWIEAEQAKPAIVPFAGPDDVRQAVVSAKGEGWTRSYIDPCQWDDAGRRLIARNGIAFKALRSEVGPILAARRVTVEMAA
jgi:hypothetical protein